MENQPGHIDITLGSLDHPDAFTPAIDVHKRSRLHWVEIKPVPQASEPEPPLAKQ